MNRTNTRRLVRTAAALVAAVAASSAVAPSAHADARTPSVPAEVAVPSGNRPFLSAHAEGVQIYACSATATGPAWTAVAPRADLFDRRGRKIGTHFAGPTWQVRDGSSVVGTKVDGVTVDPTAVPWLLLQASPPPARTKGGKLHGTTFIQRLETSGGLAPSADQCTGASLGLVSEVPYTAEYVFWRRGRC